MRKIILILIVLLACLLSSNVSFGVERYRIIYDTEMCEVIDDMWFHYFPDPGSKILGMLKSGEVLTLHPHDQLETNGWIFLKSKSGFIDIKNLVCYGGKEITISKNDQKRISELFNDEWWEKKQRKQPIKQAIAIKSYQSPTKIWKNARNLSPDELAKEKAENRIRNIATRKREIARKKIEDEKERREALDRYLIKTKIKEMIEKMVADQAQAAKKVAYKELLKPITYEFKDMELLQPIDLVAFNKKIQRRQFIMELFLMIASALTVIALSIYMGILYERRKYQETKFQQNLNNRTYKHNVQMQIKDLQHETLWKKHGFDRTIKMLKREIEHFNRLRRGEKDHLVELREGIRSHFNELRESEKIHFGELSERQKILFDSLSGGQKTHFKELCDSMMKAWDTTQSHSEKLLKTIDNFAIAISINKDEEKAKSLFNFKSK